ncbi:MAG TPA: hypothetical protein P5293_01410 [Bacteroidales bacterium]|nr:hypothetical protein [Bacteroidales bacterium]
MKKILLAVIMVLCFAVSAFAFGPQEMSVVSMSQCQSSIWGHQGQAQLLSTTGGAIVAGGNLQAQGGFARGSYFNAERHRCSSSVSYGSFTSASGQFQAQGAVIIPVQNHYYRPN